MKTLVVKGDEKFVLVTKIITDEILTEKVWGLEFSSYEIVLRNRVTQNSVTLWVTSWKIFTEILLSSYELDFIKY